MLGDHSHVQNIYIRTGYTDMRKQLNGLADIIQYNFDLDPYINSLFLSCVRRAGRIKAVHYEGDGFRLLYKRYESGRLQWPRTGDEAKQISEQQIRLLKEQVEVEVEKHLRKKKYVGQREELIKDIPHSKALHAIDESEKICERCGSSMVKAGEEFVRTEVQFIPARLKVIDHYRETYERRSCRKQGTPYMEKAPVPYPPVLHSLASASTIAWLIRHKFELGIPLYRQEKEWDALGLKLSRAAMSNWLLVVFRDWLSHVVRRLKQELLKQDYLHIDETQ